jgi:hypothetical protein
VLAHDRARVEVAQLEVGELRPELVAQLVAGGVGEVAGLADHLPGLASQVGQPVRTEHEHRDERDDRHLRQSDPEHAPRTCWWA